jgi:glycine/D-amino acid oxidase-like deaminating enzyme
MTSRAANRVLVIGAGLTGATIAWLSARAGSQTDVIALDRPARAAALLSPGIVNGSGPPGDPALWSTLTDAQRRAAAERAERGTALLREALLAGERPVGLRAAACAVEPVDRYDEEALRRAAELLPPSGFPVSLATGTAGTALVRPAEWVLCRRRLTFELLERARERGALLRAGLRRLKLRTSRPGQLVVGFADGDVRYDAVFWTAPGPPPWSGRPLPLERRRVRRLRCAAGAVPLDRIASSPAGDLLLLPDVARRDHVVVVQLADDAGETSPQWPRLPQAWAPFLGPVRSERTGAAWTGPHVRTFSEGGAVTVNGLTCWPVAPLVGACEEAVNAAFAAPASDPPPFS